MDEQEFKRRTKQLALRVIRVVEALPGGVAAQIIGRQLARSGTSVGANYRAACRAQSNADIIHKLKIVEEEADETVYWLELIVDAGFMPAERVKPLIAETNEILAMTVASIKTLRQK